VVVLVEMNCVLQLQAALDHKVDTVLTDTSISNDPVDLSAQGVLAIVVRLPLLAYEEIPTCGVIFNMNDGIMQLANRSLLAPYYKLGLVSTVVYGRFKGSDSGYRLRCRFRGIVDAVAVNPVKYRLTYKVVDVAGTSEPVLHWIDIHLRAEAR
jgi:hypothetical protein